jgi:hypothetical protein
MEQLGEGHQLGELTEYETDHLNSSIIIKHIQFNSMKLPKMKSEPDDWRITPNVNETEE